MLNGAKIAKVAVVWMTILYVVCVLIAWLLPSVYSAGASYIVHFGMTTGRPSLTFIGAILGLIVWDVIVYLSVWLFVWLYNHYPQA